jgi:protein required for attachment to host cells
MKRACIAIADAAGARLYLYQHLDGQDPTLRELIDLSNPGRRARDADRFSTTKPGVRRGSPDSPRSTDDHRDKHVAHWDYEFAKLVIDEIDRIMREQNLGHVILVATPKMLGDLRKVDRPLHRPGLVIDEVQRDLVGLTVPQIHDHLASLRVIAPRQRASFAQR